MKLSNCIVKAFVCMLVLVPVVASEPVAHGDTTYATDDVYVTDTPVAEKVDFVPVALYVDSGAKDLGVYQVEIKVLKGDVKIVSVEGGEHKAFAEPPYYDTAALMKGRIILATFSTQDELPTGKTKVATLHMIVTGDIVPEYEVIVKVVADADGKAIDAKITLE
jgi:hypothetical protein